MRSESVYEFGDLVPTGRKRGFLGALEDGLGGLLERHDEVHGALSSQCAMNTWVDVRL